MRNATPACSHSIPGPCWGRGWDEIATRSHELIEAWARLRGAVPIADRDGSPGLSLSFIEDGGVATGAISWQAWFELFDRGRLVFVCHNLAADGRPSSDFHLNEAHPPVGGAA